MLFSVSLQTVVQSQTASFAGFIDLLPDYNLVADSKVEPFMGSEIDLVKYAFVYDMLFDVEANFKTILSTSITSCGRR